MYIVYEISYRTWEFCFSQERTNFARWNLEERHHLALATPVDEMFDMSGISQCVCMFHTSVTSQYLIHSPTEASPPPGQLLSWTADSTCYRLWGHKSLLRLNKTWRKGTVPIQCRRFNIILFLFTYSTFSPGQITFKNIKKEMSKGRTQHTEMHWDVQYLCAVFKKLPANIRFAHIMDYKIQQSNQNFMTQAEFDLWTWGWAIYIWSKSVVPLNHLSSSFFFIHNNMYSIFFFFF